jgi:hypothetical protein
MPGPSSRTVTVTPSGSSSTSSQASVRPCCRALSTAAPTAAASSRAHGGPVSRTGEAGAARWTSAPVGSSVRRSTSPLGSASGRRRRAAGAGRPSWSARARPSCASVRPLETQARACSTAVVDRRDQPLALGGGGLQRDRLGVRGLRPPRELHDVAHDRAEQQEQHQAVDGRLRGAAAHEDRAGADGDGRDRSRRSSPTTPPTPGRERPPSSRSPSGRRPGSARST